MLLGKFFGCYFGLPTYGEDTKQIRDWEPPFTPVPPPQDRDQSINLRCSRLHLGTLSVGRSGPRTSWEIHQPPYWHAAQRFPSRIKPTLWRYKLMPFLYEGTSTSLSLAIPHLCLYFLILCSRVPASTIPPPTPERVFLPLPHHYRCLFLMHSFASKFLFLHIFWSFDFHFPCIFLLFFVILSHTPSFSLLLFFKSPDFSLTYPLWGDIFHYIHHCLANTYTWPWRGQGEMRMDV